MKDLILNYSVPEPNTGCWLWTRRLSHNGYGLVYKDQEHQRLRAHRVSYESFKGQIPNGLLVCHKCDTPACVNPDHLFLGDHKINADDMVQKKRDPQSKRTHCPNGHPYNEQNTGIYTGRRNCKTCLRLRIRARRALERFQDAASNCN